MSWPTATDYFEAIQTPALCFQDAELRQGQPVTNPMGLPLLYSGNFAAVFHIRCADGQSSYAVKCFTRTSSARQERYRYISTHLQQAALPFTVPFTYLEQGIQIKGDWFPIVKMDWVEGQPLNEFLRDRLDQPRYMDRLAQMWVKLAQMLRETRITHADLQHGNILLVPGAEENRLSLKLVDYDGMYLPPLANIPSGELGHRNFQHPQRLEKKLYSPEVDRFSHLVIYTALRAVSGQGRDLWKQFDQGENLLFVGADFQKPGGSKLLRELWRQGSEEVRALAGQLVLATQQPLDQVPLLEEVLTDGAVRLLLPDQVRDVERILGGRKTGPLPLVNNPPPPQPRADTYTVLPSPFEKTSEPELEPAVLSPVQEKSPKPKVVEGDEDGEGSATQRRQKSKPDARPKWDPRILIGAGVGGVLGLVLVGGMWLWFGSSAPKEDPNSVIVVKEKGNPNGDLEQQKSSDKDNEKKVIREDPPKKIEEAPQERKPIAVAWNEGVYEWQGKFDQDPFPKAKIGNPQETFVMELEANKTYFFDLRILETANNVGLSLQLFTQDGKPQQAKQLKSPPLRCCSMFSPLQNGTYKLNAETTAMQPCAFHLTIHDIAKPRPATAQSVPFRVLPQPTPLLVEEYRITLEGVDDLPLRSVNLSSLSSDLVLSSDGQTFFTLDKSDILKQISLGNFQEKNRLVLGQRCAVPALSGVGLLLANLEAKEIWVVDPETLAIRQRISAPTLPASDQQVRLLSAPKLHVAFVVSDLQPDSLDHLSSLILIDLDESKPVKEYIQPLRHAAVTPDGRFLFTQGDKGQLKRFRIQNTTLTLEEEGPAIAKQPTGLFVSRDSQYVCLPARDGNSLPGRLGQANITTLVFSVDKLQEPVAYLETGPGAEVFGFDTGAKLFFTQSQNNQLLIFDQQGAKKGGYGQLNSMPGERLPGRPPSGMRMLYYPAKIMQFAPLEESGKLLLRFANKVSLVELTKDGKPLRPIEFVKEPQPTPTPPPVPIPISPDNMKKAYVSIYEKGSYLRRKNFEDEEKEHLVSLIANVKYKIVCKSQYFEPDITVNDRQGVFLDGNVVPDEFFFFTPANSENYKLRVAVGNIKKNITSVPYNIIVYKEVLVKVQTEEKKEFPKFDNIIVFPPKKNSITISSGIAKTKETKSFHIQLQLRSKYTFDVRAKGFKPHIKLVTVTNKNLIQDGPKPIGPAATLVFQTNNPTYDEALVQIFAADGETGTFTLTVKKE